MTAIKDSPAQRSILIINPNTTRSMTDALRPLVDSLGFHQTKFEYFTAPSGVPSINNEEDAAVSAQACLPALKALLHHHDGFLVCCYSHHPLVAQLRHEISHSETPPSGHEHGRRKKHVAGIFECSVATCLQLLNPDQKFGIVSTGKQWEEILKDAVLSFLGDSGRYAGTETTGLNADELHTTPKEEVDRRMKDATKRLLAREADAICLGCAGMAGMDRTVREACVEQLGEVEGVRIAIVDGVVSGVIFLEGALRAAL